MSRSSWIISWLFVLSLAALFPLVPILFWAGLAVAAWYIKRIPERRLPYTAFFATHQPTFYDWLSDFLTSWQRTPMFAFIALIVLSAAVWGALALRLVSLPSYGASVEIRNSNGGLVGGLSTTGNASECFSNLADGKYTISEVNMPGFFRLHRMWYLRRFSLDPWCL